MDFLDPKKRKAHRIKLFIGYGMMAIALTFASIILLYQSYGYDIDTHTGQIVQNGLVYLSAHPDAAEVFLNGQSRGKTDSRLDIRAGDYNLELKSAGYRSWKRDFTLEGGSIERFLYPFLFPLDLKSSDIQTYSALPALITQSPDRRFVLFQQAGSYRDFSLIDISSKAAAPTNFSLPGTLLDAKGETHNLELVEWSADNRHVLLKHTFAAGAEYVVVDTQSPTSSVNLTKTLKAGFTTLNLRDKKYDQYYIFNSSDHALFTASLKDPAAVLYQSDVLAYHSHGDQEVAFMTAKGASDGKAWLKIREGDSTYAVRQFPLGTKYLVDLARFNDDWYVAAGTVEDSRVYLFKNPVAASKSKVDRQVQAIAVLRTPTLPEFISFSTNARFIVAQSANNFAVYDAETAKQYRYDIGLGFGPGQKAIWMDGHRLTAVLGGTTQVFDYDGINKQTLVPAYDNSQPFFDPNYEAMFTISPAKKDVSVPALVRTELRVTP